MIPVKTVPNARKVALKSYSMWANYLGLLALILPEVLFFVWQIDTNPRLWWGLGLGLLIAATIGRLIHQGMDDDRNTLRCAAGPVTIAAFLAVAFPLVAKWEGLRTDAYQDIVGVWTVCYGETKGVRPGDSYTETECRGMLEAELVEYREGLHGHYTAATIAGRLTPERDAAFVSLAYNVGVAGAGRSTAVRRLNAGRVAGACEALTWWNRAGGRVIRGLVNRRAEERGLCLRGVA